MIAFVGVLVKRQQIKGKFCQKTGTDCYLNLVQFTFIYILSAGLCRDSYMPLSFYLCDSESEGSVLYYS